MDFGVLVLPKPNQCGQQARLAEECGFTHVWVGDTHMMAGDVYVCLGLIAQQTKRVKLGTGVAVAGSGVGSGVAVDGRDVLAAGVGVAGGGVGAAQPTTSAIVTRQRASRSCAVKRCRRCTRRLGKRQRIRFRYS